MRSWSVVEVKTESMRFSECFIYASTSFSSILFRVQSFYFVTNVSQTLGRCSLSCVPVQATTFSSYSTFLQNVDSCYSVALRVSIIVGKKKNVAPCCPLRIEAGNFKEVWATRGNASRQKQMFLRCVQFVDADTIVLVVCTLVCPLRYVNTSLRYVASIPSVNFSYNRINVLR